MKDTSKKEASQQADFERFCDSVYIKLCDSGLDPEAAGVLLDKYGDTVVKDSFTNGRSAAETAAAVNSAHNDESESKKKEGLRLELVDTITVPMWLYDAYIMGKEYGGNLTMTEQEKLSDFKAQYGEYYLDNHDEEAQYHGTNPFDGIGGLCYDVDVYKRSSDESKKDGSKDEGAAGYGIDNPEGFAELARLLEADGFNTQFDDRYAGCLVVLKGDKAWVVEYNTDGPEDDPEELWDLFADVDDGGEYIAGFASIPDLVAYLKRLVEGGSKKSEDVKTVAGDPGASVYVYIGESGSGKDRRIKLEGPAFFDKLLSLRKAGTYVSIGPAEGSREWNKLDAEDQKFYKGLQDKAKKLKSYKEMGSFLGKLCSDNESFLFAVRQGNDAVWVNPKAVKELLDNEWRGTDKYWIEDACGVWAYHEKEYDKWKKRFGKDEGLDDGQIQDFDIDCESCLQALDEMKKKVLEWKEQGYYGVDDPHEASRLCRALRDVESKFEIR